MKKRWSYGCEGSYPNCCLGSNRAHEAAKSCCYAIRSAARTGVTCAGRSAGLNNSAGSLGVGEIRSIDAVPNRIKVEDPSKGTAPRADETDTFRAATANSLSAIGGTEILFSAGSGGRRSSAETGRFSLCVLSCMRAVRSTACNRWDTACRMIGSSWSFR